MPRPSPSPWFLDDENALNKSRYRFGADTRGLVLNPDRDEPHILPQRLRGGITEQPLAGLIVHQDAGMLVDDDGVVGGIEHAQQQRFGWHRLDRSAFHDRHSAQWRPRTRRPAYINLLDPTSQGQGE